MPVDFGKVSINALYSEDATYTDPKLKFVPAAYTLSPVRCTTGIADVTSSGRYLAQVGASTALLVVKNPGTIPVEITWTSLKATVVLGGSQPLTFSNSAKTITLSGSGLPNLSTSMASGAFVTISGAGLNVLNTALCLVTQVSSTVITVPADITLYDQAINSLTIKVLRQGFTALPAGGVAVIPDAMTLYNILATSTGGDTEVEFMLMVP